MCWLVFGGPLVYPQLRRGQQLPPTRLESLFFISPQPRREEQLPPTQMLRLQQAALSLQRKLLHQEAVLWDARRPRRQHHPPRVR